MERTIFFRTLILTASCMALLTACNDGQPEAPYADNTSENTIRIKFPARAGGTTDPDLENTLDEEKFHYLRILVAKTDGTSVKVYNFSTKGEPDSTPFPAGQDIVLDDVPAGNLMIYAIANEEMLGLDLSQESAWNTLETISSNGKEKKKLFFYDTYNPKKYPITAEQLAKADTDTGKGYCGLPMSWYVSDTQQATELNVEMKHIVSKVILNITYTGSQTSITLKDISFGPFMGNKIYLFEETDPDFPDVPADSEYDTYHFRNINKTLTQKQVSTQTYYIYPSEIEDTHLAENSYTIGFTATGADGREIIYEPKPMMNKQTNNAITGIGRNQILKVDISLGEGASEADFGMTCTVEEWDNKELDVPAFN